MKRGEMGGAGKLSKLSILVAQLESIVAAATHQNPEPLICFDLLVDLMATLKQESKPSIVPCQRQCEDALQALLTLGVGPPVRRLAASAIVRLIEKGDSISIYSRTSSLQGWLIDKMDRKSDPSSCIGVAQCLGALLQAFGQKVASGLVETNGIVAKLMRYSEVGVRRAALSLLQDALEGSGGGGAVAAYAEALRIIMKFGVYDKSALVRAAAAGCLRVFAVIGGPGVGVSGLENCCALCLKALEDSAQLVRDGFAAALGALLALGLNPQGQAQSSSKGSALPSKPVDGGLQKHLMTPFIRSSGPHYKEIRVSLTMALVAFLQGMRLNYLRSDLELQEFAMQAIGILASSPDTHAQACLVFCLRVGFIEQMGESTQKHFTDHLIKQVSVPDIKPAMLVVILRTLSHLLATLGEISVASRDLLENSLVALLSNSSPVVRVEAALVLRMLAEVDATSANNLLSCGLTTLRALRETVAVEKGDRLRLELDSLHGQAAMLAALLIACPRLVLGVPSRLPAAVWDVAKAMVLQKNGNPISVGAENEAGWMLLASIVSSMPKEEIEEQRLEILSLWTIEFGGNVEERLKRAQNFLSVHLSVWSAAVEALTAFVKNFVVPSMSALNEGILLQPLISYLSGALAYLSSSILQQAFAGLKPAIDLFTIRILRAFQAIPDPLAYQQDHSLLLSMCTAPFRDPASYEASSCLRQLLDSRDASLGPWVPGRDSFEDELRAFEGGADDLSPCVWSYEVSAFPQPLPVTTMLLDEMLLCFGTLFAAQTEKKKLQYVQIVVEAARAGKRQSWHSANITNTCVALLRALKSSIGLRSQGSEVEAMNQLQTILQGILGEDGVSPAERRAAAEGLGILARLGRDSYAAQLTRVLLSEARAPANFLLKGSIALALGCVHQSVGGMALSALVPTTVQTLCALAKDPSEGFPAWSLHGLWLTADAAGLSYVPHVQATLALVMELLLSEEGVTPALGQSIGRLINAVVAVLGPELSPGSSLFTRCKAVVAMIGTRDEPASLLECVLFTQQLVLFAPRAVPVHAHVKTLRPTLFSRQPSLRQAAVSTLHHLSERDAVAMCEERIEQDLFAMLDKETDESIIHIVRSTLQHLFEEACPSLPSRWLHLCRNVVLSASTTKSAADGFEGPDNVQLDPAVDTFGDDDQGMITENASAGQTRGRAGENDAKDVDQLPRFKTRVFAAECLCRLPIVVGIDTAHFDLERAKALQGHGDWLVLHLGELVAVAYQVATGTMEIVRPMGIELLDVILEKFGDTRDPMYEGHFLLEQYQAQLVSAARTALDPSASPLLVATGSKLVARIITSGNARGDSALLQRLVTLLTRQLLKWDDIVNPNYAEWVGCKVQVTLLGAHACLKTYAFACSVEGTKRSSDGMIIKSLLTQYANILGRYWMGLLRDFTALRLYAKSKLPNEYKPFLDGIQIVTIAHAVEQYLSEVWLIVLEAVTVDACPPAAARSSQKKDEDVLSSTQGIELSGEEFRQLWALSVLMLRSANVKAVERKHTDTGIPSHSSRLLTSEPEVICWVGALNALRCLSREGFYSPDMISLKLCRELMQMISTPRLHENFIAASAVLTLVDQIVKSSPRVYMERKDISLQVVELCLHHVFHVLARNRTVSPVGKVDKLDEGLSSALQILGNLVGHLNAEGQDLLLPQLLSAGVKLLNLVLVDSTPASSLLRFITSVTAAIAKPVNGSTASQELNLTTRASILAAAAESTAQLSIKYAEQAAKEQDEMEGVDRAVVKHLKLVVEAMLVMVGAVPDVDSAEQGNFRKVARGCCINCLHSLLSSRDIQIQLATLQQLATVATAVSTEQPVGEDRTWAILLLHEVGADVMQVVYSSTQKSLTTASAAAVAESLRLLILWHSLVEGDEAQQNVLHLLLPAMISAATAENVDNNVQGPTPLKTAVVKLVTRLASIPSSATQFRTVMLELHPESRQQLQTIIKASMQQPTPKIVLPSPAPSHLEFPKPVIPSTSNAGKLFLPPPSSSLKPPAVIQQAAVDDEDGDDDWDDFQDSNEMTSEVAATVSEVDKKDDTDEKDNTHEREDTDEKDEGNTSSVLAPAVHETEEENDTDEKDDRFTSSLSAPAVQETEENDSEKDDRDISFMLAPTVQETKQENDTDKKDDRDTSFVLAPAVQETKENDADMKDDRNALSILAPAVRGTEEKSNTAEQDDGDTSSVLATSAPETDKKEDADMASALAPETDMEDKDVTSVLPPAMPETDKTLIVAPSLPGTEEKDDVDKTSVSIPAVPESEEKDDMDMASTSAPPVSETEDEAIAVERHA